MQRIGSAQRFILDRIDRNPIGVTDLARVYFGVDDPTRAQMETMRRAIRTLVARGLAARAIVDGPTRIRTVRGRAIGVTAPCSGDATCPACYYGASWYPADDMEHGYHRWTPIRAARRVSAARSRPTRQTSEMAVRTPFAPEERDRFAALLGELPKGDLTP